MSVDSSDITKVEVVAIKADPNGPLSQNPYFFFEIKNLEEFVAYQKGAPSNKSDNPDDDFVMDITIRTHGFLPGVGGDAETKQALQIILDLLVESF